MRQSILDDEFPFDFLKWEERVVIDSGAFSKVFKVENPRENKFYAVKQFEMDRQNPEESLSIVQNQVFIMSEVESPYTIRLVDYNIGDRYSYIIMEFCDGDLKHLISKQRAKLPEAQCITYLQDIVLGLNALYSQDYVHRDVKPANVLIKDGRCKITDFTFATKMKQKHQTVFYDSCGTPVYMAPQVLHRQPFTAKCDIWSLGIVFYELLYGYTPWPMRKIEVYKNCILKQKVVFPFGKKISELSKDFIKKCLVIEEHKRISWRQLLKHPIFTKKQQQNINQSQQTHQFIDPILKWMLETIKEEVTTQKIDVNAIFEKYEDHDYFDFTTFCAVLREINPTVTTHQCDFLFNLLAKGDPEMVQKKQFEIMFAEINFKKCNQIINRQIKEIVAFIQARKICLNKLFNSIDKNKSGTLDRQEFIFFIKQILPYLSQSDAILIFADIDKDNSGTISREEFLKHLGYAIVHKYNDQDIIKVRAYRNLLNLRRYIKASGWTPEEIMTKVDENQNKKIEPCEFLNILRKIRYAISGQQVLEIFKVIDADHSGSIDLEELRRFLRQGVSQNH